MISLARRTGMKPRADTTRHRPAPRIRLAALPGCVLLAVLAVAGCADGGPADRPGATPSGGGSSVTAPGSPSASDPSGPPAGDPNDPGGPGKPPVAPATKPPVKGVPNPSGPSAAMTLTGTVTAGVEPNCFLLDGYLLIGGPRDVVKPGARISVIGRAEPDLMTTCQQGTPFRVESARPA